MFSKIGLSFWLTAPLVILFALFSPPVLAKKGSVNPGTDDGSIVPTATGETFAPGGGGGGGGSGPRCDYEELPDGFGVFGGQGNGSTGKTPGTRRGPNGTERLYLRTCAGGTNGLVYVAPVDVAALRESALNEVKRQLPLPSLDVSPSGGGFIRVQNWLAVAPAADVSATAAVGPVWITMTAVQDSLSWQMGDGGEVDCESPTGSPLPGGVGNILADGVNGAAECGYTFEHVSAPQFGANSALAYENSVTSHWEVSWFDYTGASGILPDPLDRTTPWTFQVRQIQTQRAADS